MSNEALLSDDFLRELIGVGDLDVVVGVPSFNDAKTIVSVIQAVEEGVLRNFHRERVVLLNVDGGSRDGTQEMLRQASSLSRAKELRIESLRTLRWITTKSRSDGSRGNLLPPILAAADLLHAKACVVISASSANAKPSWLATLLNPIFRENYDFVAPLYTRHKFDGLLTKNLLYPISRALYGKPIRELLASEFAFSGVLASEGVSEQNSDYGAARGGAEMWMAINVISRSFRCCQTYLGPKPRSTTGTSEVNAVAQTVSGLFRSLETTESYWQGATGCAPLHTIGPDHDLSKEAIHIDRSKKLQLFKSGVNELSGLLAKILSPETHADVLRAAQFDVNEFRFSNDLWVRVIYEFAAAYHRTVMDREHLVQALIPIYRGRVYSFATQHRASDDEAVEADMEDLCLEFAKQKHYLIERWNLKKEGSS